MKVFNKLQQHQTLFILIILILIAIFSFIFCLFLYSYGNTENTKNATLIFSYSENSNGLEVDNSMPITDAIGKQLTFSPDQTKYGYSEFSISSTMEGIESVNYEIYAIPVGVALELPTDYVKVYLTDGKDDSPMEDYRSSIPTYSDLKVAKADPAGKKLYSGVLEKEETKKFRLRIWLRDTYPITMEKRSFKILLYAKVID